MSYSTVPILYLLSMSSNNFVIRVTTLIYTTTSVRMLFFTCSYMSNAGYRLPSGRWLATPSQPLQPLHAGGAGMYVPSLLVL
jgi:hypothetical protein